MPSSMPYAQAFQNLILCKNTWTLRVIHYYSLAVAAKNEGPLKYILANLAIKYSKVPYNTGSEVVADSYTRMYTVCCSQTLINVSYVRYQSKFKNRYFTGNYAQLYEV
uniref:Uncharacterized protein n=1 Tax=Glossina pallidipes TaxID=7398 RepID=A0A1A9ZZG1_GLOPL